MHEGVIGGIFFILVIVAVFIARRLKAGDSDSVVRKSELAEMVRSAEVANNGFFRSLELVQKNLETLIARAEATEQRLRGLMLHSGIEKREQYTAAALLLAEGHDVERVSSMLGLPETQVQLIRELQQITGKDRRSGRGRRSDDPAGKEPLRQAKRAANGEKSAAPPILLVDVLKNASGEDLKRQESLERFKAVTV